MKNPNSRLFYLLPLLLTVALIVFGEALSDLWKEDVKALFWHNKWALLFIVLLIALVIYLWERQQRSEKPAAEEVDKDQYDEAFVQLRKNLLEQYQTRLRSKTGRRLPVNLTAKSTHFGMAPERVEAYFKDKELTIESEDIASEIDKILKKFDRLLLIGDPGAGKTTILLYAAINILRDAREPKLPLILNLATWSKGRDFAEWYTQNIAHTYSLSPVFVQELLLRNAVVPFFDGFDEVAEEYRDDCFHQMAAYFGDQSNRQLVVSSRKKEYAAAEADAPVYAEIEVQPLSLAQIKRSLSENAESQAADRALLHALEHDLWLAEAVETPFYLNTASFLFGKSQKMLKDFSFEADSTEGRQAELVEIFVAEQVPEEQDRKYLHLLAEKMEEENFLVFELVKMQPGWCEKVWWYRLIFILQFSLLLSLAFGLVFQSFLVFILGFCLAFSLYLRVEWNIKTFDIEIWSFQACIKNWRYGLYFGLIGMLIFWLLGQISNNTLTGVAFGLVCIYAGIRESGMTRGHFLHILTPYKRLNLSSNLYGTWKHFSLRLVLYLEGKMPLRVVTFMDRMTDQLIFEDNRRTDKKGKKMRGATWRFRHKILQDYFAKLQ